MTHDKKWYREQMNHLETQLTETDRQWFDELREYTTLGALMRDETVVNAQLYTMMTDLLAAEEAGGDAPTLFGQAPKTMADELLKQLPPARWQDSLSLIGIVFGVIWLTLIIGGGMIGDTFTISFFAFLLIPTFTAIVILGVIAIVRTQIYATARLLHSTVGAFLILWVLLIIYLSGTILLLLRFPYTWAVTLFFPWDAIVVGLATLVTVLIVWRVKDHLFHPLGFMAVVIGGVTLLRQLWQHFHFWPRWVLITVVLGVTLISYLVFILWSKRVAKD